MKNEVAIYGKNNFVSLPTQHELEVLNVIAQQAVTSKMYKNIGDLPGLLMVMLAARELNISPVMAINGGLAIIQGKVEIAARLMNALIRNAGHSIQKIKETKEACVLIGKRNDNGDAMEASYTIEEAKEAGLVRPGSNWIKYPKDMLFARALSRLARQLFSDVIGIGYVEGEISGAINSDNNGNNEVILAEPVVNPEEKEKKLIDTLLKEFEKSDHENLIVYIDEVMKHFDWTLEKTLEELTKDVSSSKQKFAKWKLLKEKKLNG